MKMTELTPTESNLIRMITPSVSERSREPGDAWDQAAGILRRFVAGPVHNHGPDEGPGITCPETRTESGLRGACLGPAPVEGEAPDICTCFDECRMIRHLLGPVPARPEVEGETPETDAVEFARRQEGDGLLTLARDALALARSLECRLRSPGAGDRPCDYCQRWPHPDAQPREWDAETIKDAPDGLYWVGEIRAGSDVSWSRWRTPKLKPGCLELLDCIPQHREGGWFRFYGPIPQPPATTGEA